MRMETTSSPSRHSDDMAVEQGAVASSPSPSLSAPTYHFKILVPAVAAGAIIGKGGETIAQVQKECGARVKMSKSNDFYPGTNERVCLITGSVDGVIRIHNFIMDKIKEKPDPNSKNVPDLDHKQSTEREKQVKILVPNSTAGMIIGKGGSYVKQIKEDCNVYIQLSQKSRDHALAERSITIIGEQEPTRKAVDLVLAKIVEDPQSGSCPNVSYADVQGPVANFNPTGSPYANPTGSQHSPPSGVNSTGYNSNGSGSSLSSSTQQIQQQYVAAVAGSLPGALSQNAMANPENMKLIIRQLGFSEQATTEILRASTVLAHYGLVSPLAFGQMLNNHPPLNMTLQHQLYENPVFGPIGTGFSTPANARSLDNSSNTSASFDPFRRVAGSPLTTPPPGATPAPQSHAQQLQQIVNNNSFGLGTPGGAGSSTPLSGGALRKSPTPGEMTAKLSVDSVQKDVEVGENIVGAILGPGGKALVEIQRFSGASIQISKKGSFAPGTRNRIVSIQGNPTAVSTAQYLIQQHVAEEESKRSQQNVLTVLR